MLGRLGARLATAEQEVTIPALGENGSGLIAYVFKSGTGANTAKARPTFGGLGGEIELSNPAFGAAERAAECEKRFFSRRPTRRYSQLGWLTGDRPPCVLGSAVSGKADLGRLCQL